MSMPKCKGTVMGTQKQGTQSIVGRNISTVVLVFLLYSYYILEVPCLGFPSAIYASGHELPCAS